MKIIILTLTLTLMLTGASQAQTLAEALQSCTDEMDNLARLTCFDKLAPPLKPSESDSVSKATAKKTLPPVPEISEVSIKKQQAKAESNTKQVEEFGLANKPAPHGKLNKVVAIITNVSKDPYGKLIISLDNQHVWKQSDGDRFRLKIGEQVYVEEGALNSFFLSKESVNKRIRVKRLN
ncbi:MAG: hypothetical protein ACI88A_004972 [Paraglaciecola sp.]|jgi:hypothetical protein